MACCFDMCSKSPTHGSATKNDPSNGNIFRVTGPLCGEFTGPGAGGLRRYRGHYDVIVMQSTHLI